MLTFLTPRQAGFGPRDLGTLELLNAFGAASADLPSDVRVVLLRDAGRAFSADHDLNWSAEEHAKGMKTQAALAAATECLHAITRQIRA